MSFSIGKRLLDFGALTPVLGFHTVGRIGSVRQATDAIVMRAFDLARRLDDTACGIGNLRRNAVIDTLIRLRPLDHAAQRRPQV